MSAKNALTGNLQQVFDLSEKLNRLNTAQLVGACAGFAVMGFAVGGIGFIPAAVSGGILVYRLLEYFFVGRKTASRKLLEAEFDSLIRMQSDIDRQNFPNQVASDFYAVVEKRLRRLEG